ncbi:F-box domain-containing protein [Mycena chlorophos]|uniref:F-box domain-containing protein n=1 Tax=Mycena chlorophos TaxID=658473 RepID=A0A8H6W7D0_MYCCL|nr:F-box domain-containing protein [Mycena chlorophos]
MAALRPLPNDVLTEIFHLLPAPPWEIMGVCRRWREGCINTFRLWRVVLEHWEQEYLESIVALRAGHAVDLPVLHTLDIEFVHDYLPGQSRLISTLAPTIRVLSLGRVNEELMAELRNMLPTCEMPHLRSLSLGTWPAGDPTIVLAGPSLEMLSLRGLAWTPDPTKTIAALTRLELTDSKMSVSTLCDVLRRLPRLRILMLNHAIDLEATLASWDPHSSLVHLDALETLIISDKKTAIQCILGRISFRETTKIAVEYGDVVTLADLNAVGLVERAHRLAVDNECGDRPVELTPDAGLGYKIELRSSTSDSDAVPIFSCAFVAQRQSEGPMVHALVAALAQSQVSKLRLLYTEGLPDSLWGDLHARVVSSLTAITFSFARRNGLSLLPFLTAALSAMGASASDAQRAETDKVNAPVSIHTIELDLTPRAVDVIWRDVQTNFLPSVFGLLEAYRSTTGHVLPRLQVDLWDEEKEKQRWATAVDSMQTQRNMRLDELVGEVQIVLKNREPRKQLAVKHG